MENKIFLIVLLVGVTYTVQADRIKWNKNDVRKLFRRDTPSGSQLIGDVAKRVMSVLGSEKSSIQSEKTSESTSETGAQSSLTDCLKTIVALAKANPCTDDEVSTFKVQVKKALSTLSQAFEDFNQQHIATCALVSKQLNSIKQAISDEQNTVDSWKITCSSSSSSSSVSVSGCQDFLKRMAASMDSCNDMQTACSSYANRFVPIPPTDPVYLSSCGAPPSYTDTCLPPSCDNGNYGCAAAACNAITSNICPYSK